MAIRGTQSEGNNDVINKGNDWSGMLCFEINGVSFRSSDVCRIFTNCLPPSGCKFFTNPMWGWQEMGTDPVWDRQTPWSHHHEVMAHLRGYSHQDWVSSHEGSWLGSWSVNRDWHAMHPNAAYQVQELQLLLHTWHICLAPFLGAICKKLNNFDAADLISNDMHLRFSWQFIKLYLEKVLLYYSFHTCVRTVFDPSLTKCCWKFALENPAEKWGNHNWEMHHIHRFTIGVLTKTQEGKSL